MDSSAARRMIVEVNPRWRAIMAAHGVDWAGNRLQSAPSRRGTTFRRRTQGLVSFGSSEKDLIDLIIDFTPLAEAEDYGDGQTHGRNHID